MHDSRKNMSYEDQILLFEKQCSYVNEKPLPADSAKQPSAGQIEMQVTQLLSQPGSGSLSTKQVTKRRPRAVSPTKRVRGLVVSPLSRW